jgi:hypothetical protein
MLSEKINLQREKVYFGSQFWRFQSLNSPLPVVRQHILAKAQGGSCPSHDQEAKESKRKGPGTQALQ